MWRDWTDTSRPERLVGTATVASFVLIRVTTWVLSLPVVITGDSLSYLPGPEEAVPPSGLVDFTKVSLLGNGVVRPWPIALFYSLLPQMELRSFVQLLLGTFAALVLAYAVWRLPLSRIPRTVLVCSVLVFYSTPEVVGWDLQILREPLLLALSTACVGLVMLGLMQRRVVWAVLAFVTSVLVLVIRPTFAPFVMAIDLAVAYTLWRRMADDLVSLRRRILVLGCLITLGVAAVGYTAFLQNNMDASWERWYSQTQSQAHFGYVVSDQNVHVEHVIAAIEKEDAPECLIDALPVDTSVWMGAPWGFYLGMSEVCPGFGEWYEATWPGWYYSFLVNNPEYVFRTAITQLRFGLSAPRMPNVTSPLPGPVSAFFFESGSGLEPTARYDPLFLYVPVAALLAILALAFNNWSIHVRGRGREVELVVFFILLGLSLVGSFLFNAMLVPDSPASIARIGLVSVMGIRLLGWGLLVVAFVTLASTIRDFQVRSKDSL